MVPQDQCKIVTLIKKFTLIESCKIQGWTPAMHVSKVCHLLQLLLLFHCLRERDIFHELILRYLIILVQNNQIKQQVTLSDSLTTRFSLYKCTQMKKSSANNSLEWGKEEASLAGLP